MDARSVTVTLEELLVEIEHLKVTLKWLRP